MEPYYNKNKMENDSMTMEEGSELFEIDVGDGKTLYVEIRGGDTIKDLRERLEAAGVNMDVSVDGSALDEQTNALAYFSALSSNKLDVKDEELIPITDPNELSSLEESLQDTQEVAGMFCSVIGCATNKYDNPEIALFRFPSSRKRCMNWIQAIGRPELADKPIEELCEHNSVCANHFAQAQFANHERKLLKNTAIPIIFKASGIETIDVASVKPLETLPVLVVKSELEEIEQSTQIDSKWKEVELEEGCTHPGSLCRLCANPIDSTACFIFKADQNGKTIADKINACLPLIVKKTDLLPKQICFVCSQHVSLQYTFVESCLQAEEKLQNVSRTFAVNGLKKAVLTTPEGIKRGKSRQSYCCPLCCHGAMRYMTQNQPESMRNKTTDATQIDSASQDFLWGLYSDDNDSDAGGEPKHGSEGDEVGTTSPVIYLPEDKAFFSFDCDICEEVFSGPFDCLEHCKFHASVDYFPCIVCGNVLANEEDLQQHFEDHAVNMTTSRRFLWKPLLECGTCKIQFTTKKDFILHKCSTPLLKILRGDGADTSCKTCERSFKTGTRANVHKARHEGGELYSCSECGFEAETAWILNDHVSTIHEAPVVHTCSHCTLRFINETYLEKHRKVHQALFYQCSICSKTFASMEATEKHMKTHGIKADVNSSEKKDIACPKCWETFNHRSQLQHHLEVAHDSMKRMPSLIQYQCKLCGERATTSSQVLIHRTAHFKGIEPLWPYVCEYCGEAHPSPNALARHRRFLHPDERPYVCTLCEVTTRTLYEARVHRKTHTGYVSTPQKPQPKIYQCEHCPGLFTEKLSFLAHKKCHKVAKWFKCDQCDKSFPERHRLNVHKRQHTGEKPYTCGTCGKKFTQTSAIYTHALLHTGETPHECDLCGKKFRIKLDRDNHRRTHTGEKPYKCQYCSKTFRTGQVYYQHRMIHTGERRFPCDICGRAFKRSHTLVCHRRIHTGEKPNVCDICGKGFRQRTDMRKHKINLHGISA